MSAAGEGNEGKYRKRFMNAKARPNNMYYTPDYAMQYIAEHVKPFARVWEPCCGAGHMVRFLEQRGHAVTATDIHMGPEFDVLTYAPPADSYDIVVTNPPFQGKRKFLRRLFALGKPFAILMPTMVLDSNPCRALLKAHGDFGLLMPGRTINYIPKEYHDATADANAPPRSSQSFFHSSWLCYKIPTVQGLVLL